MLNDDNCMNGEDVGWEWERDLESQGHGECWRVSHLEDAFRALEDDGTGVLVRRSDVHIFEEVCALLAGHPLIDATEVRVEVVDGVVVLRGDVCTRQEIVLCVDVISEVAGISGREILLRVRANEPIRWDEIGLEAP